MARTPIISQTNLNRAPYPIVLAFERLERAANVAQSLATVVNAEQAGNRIRNRLVFSALGPGAGGTPPPEVTVANFCAVRRQGWIDDMKSYVSRTYPKATPTDDVIHGMRRTVDRAIGHEYPLQDNTVREALCELALAERTNDYEGEDTTGTQIGNHTGGGLRGLGFSDD